MISESAIMGKIRKYASSAEGKARMQKKINTYIASGVSRSEAGGSIISIREMNDLAKQMMRFIQQAGGALPESVRNDLSGMTATSPAQVGNNIYEVIISTPEVPRRSLLISKGDGSNRYTGDGVYDIIGLFDSGYSTDGRVYGVWEGHEGLGRIGSRMSREGLHFLQGACDTFNRMYWKDGCTASLRK